MADETAASATRNRTARNGSVLIGGEDLPSVGGARATEASAIEPPAVELNGHNEQEPSPRVETSTRKTEAREVSWGAVRGWVGTNRLSSGLAAALVAVVVLLILSQLSLNSKDSLNSAGTSALAAAKSFSVDLASYNYQHLDQDFGKVLAESTPSFKQSFSQSSDALKTTLTRYDASAQASVVAAGLVSVSTNRAVVLVFLNQTVKNSMGKGKPTSDESRVEITLLRSGGRWLINQISLL